MGTTGWVLGGSMSFRPILRLNLSKDKPSNANGGSNGAANFFSLDPADEITGVAKAVADAGGGAVSLNLALDLVLNEVVERARQATGASGAAIALARDGEMICRATTGNAPELGTRVETASGLSAAVLTTGTIQQCVDTEQDPRVDLETCRHLQLRSMLLVPIAGDDGPLGILEVFSSTPNKFGDEDVKRLQFLARKIVASRNAAEEAAEEKGIGERRWPNGLNGSPPERVDLDPISERLKILTEPPKKSGTEGETFRPEQPSKNEILTSALVVLVIAAAVLLGVVIGVRQAAKHREQTLAATTPQKTKNPHSGSGPAKITENPGSKATRPADPPVGGLIVTQNGKVIYRADSSQDANRAPITIEDSVSRPVRRVDPQYPEAARSQRIEGPVVLDAQVLGDGTVGNIAVLKGDPLLAEAAMQAVKQWKYQPYIVRGRAVERQERITVNFSLPSS